MTLTFNQKSIDPTRHDMLHWSLSAVEVQHPIQFSNILSAPEYNKPKA